MVVFGAMLFAIRLRYASLSTGWLVHFLFNAQPFLIYPGDRLARTGVASG